MSVISSNQSWTSRVISPPQPCMFLFRFAPFPSFSPSNWLVFASMRWGFWIRCSLEDASQNLIHLVDLLGRIEITGSHHDLGLIMSKWAALNLASIIHKICRQVLQSFRNRVPLWKPHPASSTKWTSIASFVRLNPHWAGLWKGTGLWGLTVPLSTHPNAPLYAKGHTTELVA